MKTDEHGDAPAILRRVEADQRSFIAPGPEAAAGDGEADRVEVWARRTGRVLGYALLALLAVNLFTGWFF